MNIRTLRRRVTVAASMMALVAATACTGGGSSDSGSVTIGLLVPRTGPAATLSEPAIEGVKLALDQAREKGLPDNVEIKLKIEDDKCSPVDSVNATRKLIADGAAALIGPTCSSPVVGTIPTLDKAGVPAVIWKASSHKIVEQGSENVFVTIPDEVVQAKILGQEIANNDSVKRLAFLVEQSDAGIGSRDRIRTFVEKQRPDIKIVEDLQVDPAQTDFSGIVSRLADSDADAVVVQMLVEQGAQFLQAYRVRDVGAQIYSTVGWPYPLFEETVGAAKADGIIREAFWLPSADNGDVSKAFADAYKARHDGTEPGSDVAVAYDSMRVLIQAVRDGARTSADIRSALQDIQVEGATGPISFEKNGERSPVSTTPRMFKSVDGRAVPIGDDQS